ncbi:MAG: hypothetical protein JSW07_02135 [bacterium]|nr:MAG: hypothetical protein JSW07_02135 [bacterium]
MSKLAYLDKNLQYYFLILMLILILMLSSGNYTNSIATEKPESNQSQPEKLQDEKNKGSDGKSISNEDVKIFLNQIEIYGQIAKPQTVFIIPGTDPRVDGLRIDRHFFFHIFRPVEKSTLRRVRIKQGKDKDHILW